MNSFIVSRKIFDAVQTEMARRSAGKSPSKKTAPTGMSCFTSKYALSERLVCGECGTLYRRCTWSKNGRKRIVWRCVSRLDYGKKYCHSSPTIDEEPLQRSILAAINSAMSKKSDLIQQLTTAMELELAPIPGETMSIAEINGRLEGLNREFQELLSRASEEGAAAYSDQFKAIADESAQLKENKARVEAQRRESGESVQRVSRAVDAMTQASEEITKWDETMIRQLVDTVKVISEDEISVYLRGGIEVNQTMLK